MVTRSGSPKRRPTATLLANAGSAPAGSPPHICPYEFQEKPTLLGALVAAFQHPAGASEPSHRRSEFAAKHEIRTQQKRIPG